MKYFFFLFLLILLTKNTIAQSNTKWHQQIRQLTSRIDSNMETHPETVISLGNQQIEIAKLMHNDSLILDAKLKQAEALFNLGIYDDCLKMRYKILAELDKQKHDKRIGELLLKIGWVYFELEDFKRYVEFATNAKKSFKETQHHTDTIRCNTEIGLGLVILGDTNNGFDLLIKTKALSKMNITDTFHKMIIYDNLSLAYTQIGDHKNALLCQLDVEQIRHKESPIYYDMASYEHLSEKYNAVQDYKNADYYSNLAIKTGKIYNNLMWLYVIYQNKASILEAQNKYREANQYLQMALELKDSIQNKDYNVKMSFVANKYELEKKQNKIMLLSKDKILATSKINQLSLGILTLLLLFIILGLYYMQRKNKQEIILKETFAKQILHAQESERQRVAKDLHDSVGQNILFIKNQLLSHDRNEVLLRKSVDNALEEVRNISKDLYPNQLEKFGLSAAVESLAEQVQISSGIFVSSDMQGIDDTLNKNVQINFYRIIQEFVNNTIKHAEATAIRITTENNHSEIKLIVQDNGKGFDKSELERKANMSSGLLNMEERIKMLKGKLEIESEMGKGTKSIFTIPV